MWGYEGVAADDLSAQGGGDVKLSVEAQMQAEEKAHGSDGEEEPECCCAAEHVLGKRG